MEQNISSDLTTEIVFSANEIIADIDAFFQTLGGVKAISFVLMLIAVILFLLLMILMFVRGVFENKKINTKKTASYAYSEDDEFTEEQNELERELQFELEMALSERHSEEQQRELEKQQKKAEVEKQVQKEQQKKEENLNKKEQKFQKNISKEIEFDWQKGKTHEKTVENIQDISLTYQQNRKELNALIGLAIDMLARGVDELKIAQTINYKNQGMNEENDILKTIDALKYFIDICAKGEFAKLKNYDSLPREDQALYNLANGDATLALALLENLMDTLIDKSQKITSDAKKQKIYAEVSQMACHFGALAELNDIMLATSSYELAIELQSDNVVAWSSLGDVYKKANSHSKSIWAYQNVVNYADAEINAQQIANSNKHISEHLYAEGNSLQAAKLYNSAKEYYDQLGINRRLDKQEIEIIQTIENNHHASLPEMIAKLLENTRE